MSKKEEIPKGIKLLILATSIRWIGWGLGEAFIPLFLFMFSANFLETGLLTSVFNIVFFLSIPLAGYLADNIKIKYMIIAGLMIYVLIGLGFFLAGITGAIIFVIIARGLNGLAFSLDQVGRETYIIRNSPKNKISSMFGKFDFITTFWWVLSVIIGFCLVKFLSVPIHWLLFFIAPCAIISALILSRLKEKKKKNNKDKKRILETYTQLFNNVKNFNNELKIILFLAFIIGIISSSIYFFVPISYYIDGNSLVSSAMFALVYATPALFGKYLGKIADKKRERIYIFSFCSIILIFIGIIVIKNYFIMLLIVFLASTIFELLSLTNRGMLARFADRTHLGEIDGSLNGVAALGAIIGPALFGLSSDLIGLDKSYMIIIFILIIVLFVIIKGLKHLKKTPKKVFNN
ncbi:MAG: Multidrug-efflux transporter, MFS transporter, DHA1 family, multidrug resistance protein [archaeon GW2011_AR13]|nr:MAG: Multidrug-efflux transporter, MFS transporter, DHA1 family, multidrug resistance protein [archaeon GW2011_AR13]HIG94656.1 MFS transporter [Nanoarchaeota archaeon]HIH63452.1 MFS transporter [Nanoarchaeota archaeon]HIJ09382.1 MFS transporter [Nanoarchaeota archaeon]